MNISRDNVTRSITHPKLNISHYCRALHPFSHYHDIGGDVKELCWYSCSPHRQVEMIQHSPPLPSSALISPITCQRFAYTPKRWIAFAGEGSWGSEKPRDDEKVSPGQSITTMICLTKLMSWGEVAWKLARVPFNKAWYWLIHSLWIVVWRALWIVAHCGCKCCCWFTYSISSEPLLGTLRFTPFQL